MRQTEQTLLDQMRISDFEIESRKALLSFDAGDVVALASCKSFIEANVDSLVTEFYEMQTSIPEIALMIGDADTLTRLKSAQRKYILDLFAGRYDLDYVNNRLRIGLVHKRIGVEPKLYLSAIHMLKELMFSRIAQEMENDPNRKTVINSLDKLLIFDITLVFETYIRSLVGEIEIERDKSNLYALSLEEKVKERTRRLEELTRTDPLTGLLNRRYLSEVLAQVIGAARRHRESVSLVYFDVDNFKRINDIKGHQRGDEVLRIIGDILTQISRSEDSCFRYGGDEFCIILPNCTEEQARVICAARLIAAIHDRLKGVFVSIGVVQTGPAEFLDADVLINLADSQMYEAKRGAKMCLPPSLCIEHADAAGLSTLRQFKVA